jgi:hypothetical protein
VSSVKNMVACKAKKQEGGRNHEKRKTTVPLCLLVTAAFLFGCAVPGESVKDVGKAAASPDAAKDTEAEKNQGTVEVTLTPAEADEAVPEPATTFTPADGTDAVPSEPLEKRRRKRR